MYYFVVQRRDLVARGFRRGYVCYGINKSYPNPADDGFRGSRFFYEGNFVVLNLRKVNLREGVESCLENSYYGVEGFWGKLCSPGKAFSPFISGINHYFTSLPEQTYIRRIHRVRYSLVRRFYQIKSWLLRHN